MAAVVAEESPAAATAAGGAASPCAFPLLSDPEAYSPFTFDLLKEESTTTGPISFATWIQVFRGSIPGFKRQAVKGGKAVEEALQKQADDFEGRFNAVLDTLAADPASDVGYDTGYRTVNCAMLCRARDLCLAAAGFGDIFAGVKAEENNKALKLLPAVLKELDSVQDPQSRFELAVRGVFSGNIFDLGAAASEELFEAEGSSFQKTRDTLPPRPWVVDNLDRLLERMRGQAHRKAMLFVDNAGSDVILGMLPLARELLKRGTRVIIAANEDPSVNDVTAEELATVIPTAAAADLEVIGRAWKSGQLAVRSTGSALCVLDMSKLSAELCAEAEDVDLVVLEGMGRSIETNLRVQLTCDVVNLGMIKHPEVASLLGGQLYGCVCRFDPSAAQLPLWKGLSAGPEEEVQLSVVWPPAAASHAAAIAGGTGPNHPNDILGEGPLWSQAEGCLYWVDIIRPVVHRLHLTTGSHSMASTSDWVGSLGLWGAADVPSARQPRKRLQHDPPPALIAAVGMSVCGLSVPATDVSAEASTIPPAEVSSFQHRLEPPDMDAEVAVNDGKVDPQGNFWVGTAVKPGCTSATQPYRPILGRTAREVDPEGAAPPGALFRVRPSPSGLSLVPHPGGGSLEVTRIETVGPVTVSNGLDWSPDGKTFYYTDSPARCVRAFDYDPVTADISGGRLFCEVPPSLPDTAVPDGLTVDSGGSVWIAFWNGGAVGCFLPDNGALARLVALPISRPTCVAFGGPGLATLFVTSCRRDKGEAEDLTAAGEPLAGCLLALRNTGATGRLPNPFAG
mmetsp:Transcript_39867/g.113104  ORF Transcript_39867/g.113104 Transcript_39867/m.113104 type:complete len:792 (+) Transcript_39867:122-2497(+)